MQIGRRIYYDKVTGALVSITSQMEGETLIDMGVLHDFAIYKALADRVPDSVGIIQLAFDEMKDDFKEGILRSVNPITKELLFSYSDPATPGEPTPPEPPLSDKVKTLESDVLNTRMALADTYEQLLSAQAETTSMQLALVDVYELLLAINT